MGDKNTRWDQAVRLDSMNPQKGARTVERALVCYIVDEQDAHGATVVGSGDGAEAFLAGCVPLCSPLTGGEARRDRRHRVTRAGQQRSHRNEWYDPQFAA